MNNFSNRAQSYDDGICFAVSVVVINFLSAVATVGLVWFVYSLLASSPSIVAPLYGIRTF